MIDPIKTREPGEGLRRRNFTPSSEIKTSLISEGVVESIRYLPLAQLIPFSKQARKVFDAQEIQSLTETIKEYGIQQPLIVMPSENNPQQFEIVSGERRFRAARQAGLEKVPCIIKNSDGKAEEIALIENTQRTDLTPIELGLGYQQLINSGKCHNADDISKKLAIPRSQVFEYLQYAKFPEAIRDRVLKISASRTFLRKLKECADEGEMEVLLSQIEVGREADIEQDSHTDLLQKDLSSPLKKRRERRNMNVLTISFNNGELLPQLRGLKVCPKEIHPQIKELLLQIIEGLES